MQTVLQAPTIRSSFRYALVRQLRYPSWYSVGERGRPTRTLQVTPEQGLALKTDRGGTLDIDLGAGELRLETRRGASEPFLDALALALGRTPFAELPAWDSRLPSRLLPGSAWLNRLQRPVHSLYHRYRAGLVWVQVGSHRSTWSTVMTRAELCPERGLVGFELHCDRVRRLSARLVKTL